MNGWKNIVGTVAPSIATALGGPLAGLAVSAIAGALGLGDGASEEQVAAAVGRATPEQLLALKKAEQEFAVKMRELDVDLERIAVSDRSSARRRESALGDGWYVKTLASMLIGGFLSMAWAVLTGKVIPDSTLAGTIIGYLSAKAEQVVAYYFGSSSGSTAKSLQIAELKNAGAPR